MNRTFIRKTGEGTHVILGRSATITKSEKSALTFFGNVSEKEAAFKAPSGNLGKFMTRKLSILLSFSTLLVPINKAQADTPALTVAEAVALVGAAVLVYKAIKTDHKTTTTHTETTKDGKTETTTTTTTETSNRTAGEESFPALFITDVNIGGWFIGDEMETSGRMNNSAGVAGVTYKKLNNNADVKKSPEHLKSIEFDIKRTTSFNITKTQGNEGAVSVPLEISIAELMVSTKDIPSTNGHAMLNIVVAKDGGKIYEFGASLSQGEKPVVSKDAEFKTINQEKDSLSISGLHKKLLIEVPAGKSEMRLEVMVRTNGLGERM